RPLEVVGRLTALPLHGVDIEILVEGQGEPVLPVLERPEADLGLGGQPKTAVESRSDLIVLGIVARGVVAPRNRTALAIGLERKLADDLAISDPILEGHRLHRSPELNLLGLERVDLEDHVVPASGLLDIREKQLVRGPFET